MVIENLDVTTKDSFSKKRTKFMQNSAFKIRKKESMKVQLN